MKISSPQIQCVSKRFPSLVTFVGLGMLCSMVFASAQTVIFQEDWADMADWTIVTPSQSNRYSLDSTVLPGENVLKTEFLTGDNFLSYIRVTQPQVIDLAAGVEYTVTFRRVADVQYFRMGLVAGDNWSSNQFYYHDFGRTSVSLSKIGAGNVVTRLYATSPALPNPLDGFVTYTMQLQEGVNEESTPGLWFRLFHDGALAAEWFDVNPFSFTSGENDTVIPFIGFRPQNIGDVTGGTYAYVSDVTLTQIPEPSTLLLWGLGASLLAFRKRF